MHRFFNNNLPSPSSFYVKKILLQKKKLACGEMLTEQIIEFEFRRLRSLGSTYTPTTAYFYDKRKPLRKIFQWIIIYS